MGNNDDNAAAYSGYNGGSSSATDSSSSTSTSSLSTSSWLDPVHVSIFLFVCLLLFVLYLLLPRGLRKRYFGAYPKRHAWSARTSSSGGSSINGGGSTSHRGSSRRSDYPSQQQQQQQGRTWWGGPQHPSSVEGSYTGGSSLTGGGGGPYSAAQQQRYNNSTEEVIDFSQPPQQRQPYAQNAAPNNANDSEIVISAAMQQLRQPGVLIVAHGSRGRPKTVRLQLTEQAITWRTETSRGGKHGKGGGQPKLGKLHQVPLSHIMYVDVGKQTTALRRVENAAVEEALCFSLLTKEGSLDLEAASVRERDALVSCFSLVLDEVHAQQNWRDLYRGPSSDMPSSFDELDANNPTGGNDKK